MFFLAAKACIIRLEGGREAGRKGGMQAGRQAGRQGGREGEREGGKGGREERPLAQAKGVAPPPRSLAGHSHPTLRPNNNMTNDNTTKQQQ